MTAGRERVWRDRAAIAIIWGKQLADVQTYAAIAVAAESRHRMEMSHGSNTANALLGAYS